MKIDLGCGPNKKEGFKGADSIDFPGVDFVCDLRARWPWDDSSVEEAHSSHFVEHLTQMSRIHFANELYRVLQPGAKATIIVPSWKSCRAYGDMTHQWPPVSEFWFYYLLEEWRIKNAPHNDAKHLEGGYSCDFDVTWGYALDPMLASRNQEYQQHAMRYFTESTQDIVATLVSRRKP